MRVILEKKKNGLKAVGEYNPQTKQLTVLKGSNVSATIAYSEKFRGAKSIENARTKWVRNGVVFADVEFKSPSTAANFITGNSTNGLTAWHDESGKSIKYINAEANTSKEVRYE